MGTITLEPADAHNQRLVEAVHPPDWTNPVPDGRYNLVVLGAGTAGLVAASIAASLGGKVALIERHLMGGDCLNVGCVPSKGLLRAARALADVRDAGRFGIHVPDGVEVDFGAVMERMRSIRADIGPHDGARRFADMGIDVYLGDATFTARDSVEVGGQTLRFTRAAICTGGRAAAPPIPGLADVDHLTNESIFSLTELPPRLAIIGAGPIGAELSQAFARFGSQVVLIELGGHILMREDPDAAAIVQAALARDGVDLRLSATIDSVSAEGDEKVIKLSVDGQATEVRVDALLVAVGRAPNVDGLGLDAAGVEFDARLGVTVDDHLQTSNAAIFAAGDVCSAYKFTHTADFLARALVQNALFSVLGLGRKRVSALKIPWCTYTDPEIAHVGLYAADAEREGIAITTFTQPLEGNDRAVLEGEAEGFVKLHVKAGSDELVGATIVARHAGEMISELTLALRGGLGLGTVADTIHPYPTQADAIRAAAGLYTRTRLTPMVAGLFAKWLSWRR
jgi:pyruvate/2-oxoglutarate dehydrogenase complex dihydrolipoamide dehydrogenase (E3) component